MTELTAQEKFLKLAKRYEELKEEMKAIKPELNLLLAEIGEGTYFQDVETSLVYKVVVPTGTYVEFSPISYERTKKVEEKRGTLSKKEAEDQGFSL